MVTGVIVICIAILVVAIALIMRSRAKAQFTWIRVPATVVSATVEYARVIYPNIEYEYVYAGRLFRGIRLQTLEVWWGFWPGPARRMVEKYPVGSAISVFVDPDDPSNAVIEPGGDHKFLPFVFAIATFAIFIGIRFIYDAKN